MKKIEETPIISIHSVSPLNMIGPPDRLRHVMLSISLPSGMTSGFALRLVTRLKWQLIIWLKRATVLFRIFWYSVTVQHNLPLQFLPQLHPDERSSKSIYSACSFRISVTFDSDKCCGISWHQNGRAEHKRDGKFYNWSNWTDVCQ